MLSTLPPSGMEPDSGAGLDLAALTAVQRALIATDGTLTDVLGAVYLEPIGLVRYPGDAPVRLTDARLELASDEARVVRRILLRGARSGTIYLYAESIVATDRLPTAFRREMDADVPIGRLFVTHRIETFKELLAFGRCQRPDVALLGWPTAECLWRTYRVSSGGRPLMLISEYLPAEMVTPGEATAPARG
jgi:chorismate-pyruvate lyase